VQTSPTYRQLFDAAYDLRTSDARRAVELFLRADEADGNARAEPLIHAGLALRDAGLHDDARPLLHAALERGAADSHHAAFELAFMAFGERSAERALVLLHSVEASKWNDKWHIVEAAALAMALRDEEAVRKLAGMQQRPIEFENPFFSRLFRDVVRDYALRGLLPGALDALGRLFDPIVATRRQLDETLRAQALNLDLCGLLEDAITEPPQRDHACSALIWMLGYRMVWRPDERPRLASLGLAFIAVLVRERISVHPTAIKNLIKGMPDCEVEHRSIIRDLCFSDPSTLVIEERLAATELSVRAGRHGRFLRTLLPPHPHFHAAFEPLIRALPRIQPSEARPIETADANVLVVLFGQCRDTRSVVPGVIDVMRSIGFRSTTFMMSTWSHEGHHVPPHRSWLRRQIDDALADRIEKHFDADGSDFWVDGHPVDLVYQAFPQLRAAFEATTDLRDALSGLVDQVLLHDEATFEKQFEQYVLRVKNTHPAAFLRSIRNTFKMWFCIDAAVTAAGRHAGSSPDFIFFVRPDLEGFEDWKGRFPRSLSTHTVYTDLDPACMTVGMGGLGDRYIILPFAFRELFRIPLRVLESSRRFLPGADVTEIERLSYHQLLDSVVMQSGLRPDITSIVLRFGLHRKMVTLDELAQRSLLPS
jgi:hypothetical protein